MSAKQSSFYQLPVAAAVFLRVLISSVLITGQSASKPHVGEPDDWSHHHLVFSNPGTYQMAMAKGIYSQWIKLHYDTRLILQQMKRGSGMRTPPRRARGRRGDTRSLDWSQPLIAGGQVQPNTYPAKWSFDDTEASCTDDFVVYPTGAVGDSTQANIVAYNNLYSGCSASGSVPSVYWAYNVGGYGYTISTSPVLSLTGSQVAFMASNGSAASLVILTWQPGSSESLSSPGALTAMAAATYQGCTTPCSLTLPFANGNNDTFSSPFYDYDNDTIYVGDDAGYLHKFTGVFNGTPGEVTTGGWPASLSATAKISSPVYNPASGYVLTGDNAGYLYAVGTGYEGTTSGSVSTSSNLGDAIMDAPLIDPNAGTYGTVYVFVTTVSVNAYSQENEVYQFAGNSVSPEASVEVGTGATGNWLYAGTLDNVYFQSPTATGNLYVVGETGSTNGAMLYQIPINNNVMGAVYTPFSAPLTLGGVYAWPSPLTEFCNGACTASGGKTDAGSTDYLFFSLNSGAVTGCTNSVGNGCAVSYNISNPAQVTLSGAQNLSNGISGRGCWATGGFVIDNSVGSGTLAGASQVYFINLNGNNAGGPASSTSGNCPSNSNVKILQAVQASQPALE